MNKSNYLECSCNGDNSNCFKCFGTGLINRSTDETRRSTRPILKEMNSRIKNKPIKAEESINFNEKIEMILKGHYQKTQNLRVKKKEEKPPKLQKVRKQPDNLVQCNLCEARVVYLDKHIKKHHTEEGIRKAKEREEKRIRRERINLEKKRLASSLRNKLNKHRIWHPDAKLCGFCHDVFDNLNLLEEHIIKAHSPNIKTQLTINNPKEIVHRVDKKTHSSSISKSKKIHSKNKANEDVLQVFQNVPNERSLDATYGVGGFAREHGKFGSASSFDNMDDESFS